MLKIVNFITELSKSGQNLSAIQRHKCWELKKCLLFSSVCYGVFTVYIYAYKFIEAS